MTERGRSAVHRTGSSLAIGPSALWWNGDTLTIRVDETAMPLPSRVRGVVRLYPAAITNFVQTLDTAGRHHWWPVAPQARVEVAFDAPSLSWSGRGYFDTNFGDEPLADGLSAGTGRAPVPPSHRGSVRRRAAGRQQPVAGGPIRCRRQCRAVPKSSAGATPDDAVAAAAANARRCRTYRCGGGNAGRCAVLRPFGHRHPPHGGTRHRNPREPVARPFPCALGADLLPFRMPRVWSRGAAAQRS